MPTRRGATSAGQGKPGAERLAIDLAVLGRVIGEHLPLAVAATQGKAHLLRWVNPTFCRLVGMPAEKLIGQPFLDALPGARADRAGEMLDRVLRTGKDESTVEPGQLPAPGNLPPRSYSVAPLFDAQGRPEGLLVRVDDSAEVMLFRERGANEELREVNQHLLLAGLRAEEQFEHAADEVVHLNALLESLHEAVTIADPAGRVLLMNPVARELWGVGAQQAGALPQFLDQLDQRRVDDSPLPPDEWPITRALRGERFSDVELILVRPDGARRRLMASGSAISTNGQILLAIVVSRDVTELRQLEQTKQEYLALISHDLRTPLTAVMGEAQLLHRLLAREDSGESAHAKRTSSILANAQRMNSMINELLESSRLESGTMTLRKQPVALSRLVSEAVERLGSERVRVQDLSPKAAPVVSADRERIERVLGNLVTNALKYSTPGTPVVVRVRRRGNEAIVSVADQGGGIPPEELPGLFERFTRGRTGIEAHTAGLGLGLYIVRLIVEAHGGRMWVESKLGKGTTFSFALAIAAPAGG